MIARQWVRPDAHDNQLSLDLVRAVAALILLVHPLHGFQHPEEIRALGQIVGAHGFPFPAALAWAAVLLQVACSAALLANRLVVPACVGHIFVLALGIWLVHAPNWFAAGNGPEDGPPGAEFSLLLIAALAGILWSQWKGPAASGSGPEREPRGAQRGLALVRIATAFVIITHPLSTILAGTLRESMQGFGHALEARGFPVGVALAWAVLVIQLTGFLCFFARVLVVPACLGLIFVHGMGMVFHHKLRWFAVGPGLDGNEYPVLIIACLLGVLLAHVPRARAMSGEGWTVPSR